MSQTYFSLLTSTGLYKLNSLLGSNSKLKISEIGVGDGAGSFVIPSEDMITLKNEVYRTHVNNIIQSADNPSLVTYQGIIPGNVGGFTIREVGLFDIDGDMIAIGNYPDTYKPSGTEGARSSLLVNITILISQIDNIDLVIDNDTILVTQADLERTFDTIDTITCGSY